MISVGAMVDGGELRTVLARAKWLQTQELADVLAEQGQLSRARRSKSALGPVY